MSDLVAQLRIDADEIEGCGGGNEAANMRKACDTITQQAAEIEKICVENTKIGNLAARYRKERDAAQAGLVAARRDVLEQAAKIASTVYWRMVPKPRNRITAENAGHIIAQDIRALAHQEISAPTPTTVEQLVGRYFDNREQSNDAAE